MIPLAAQLSGLQNASQRRFQLSFLDQTRLESNRQIKALSDTLSAELTVQKQIIDAQVTAMDALSEAYGLLQDATDEQNKTASERWIEWQDKTKIVTDILTTVQEFVDAMGTWLQQQTLGSAGGVLGPRSGMTFGIAGFPWATGDIRLTANNLALSETRCWLRCNGQEHARASFPELAALIGGRFGTASSSDNFCVPLKTELPDGAALSAALSYFIRT